ncbi:phage holin family protein [Roseomonas sp. NAR14]|uniref:Phage holin family protein n=1 Tax=Roseomonas acroporae TaxID=2937791 RepID=A0A9X1YB42_9PROT|nr:phage holin family protein [Roseomonas acroporae]MCK8787489.1 phage holin family protein [Roseomonas acroporae]
MTGFLIRTLVTAVALWVAAAVVGGLRFDSTGTLILAAILFGIVNAVVRPIFVIMTLPLTILTLGLFLFVVNAAMLGLTAALLPGMHVAGFWSAVFGAIVVWLVSWAVSAATGAADMG